jgi:VWFA-related protein
MPHGWTSSIAGFVALGAVVAAGSPIAVADSPSTPRESLASLRPGAFQRTRTVHVSVTDKKGVAIADLQATDFEVKVGGKTQTVVSARPATAPLRIALLVADAGTGAFQLGLANFMNKLLGHAEFALISVIVQPEKVVDYSTDAGALSAGLRRLGARGRQRGAQLMETIQDATREIRREATRPVILVARVGSESPTSIPPEDVRAQLRKSGAVLYVISTLGADRQAPSSARAGISVEQAQLADAEVTDGAFSLAQVLGDGARESGGRNDQVISTTLVPAFERVADELLHQYEITYEVPDSLKPGDKISVSSKRKGLTVLAPSRLP